MAILVADQLTPIPLEEGMLSLAGGYKKTMGGNPELASCLAALGSQLCLESGNFQKGHKYNWGNKKLPADWDGEYCQFKCDELFTKATADIAQNKGPCQISLWKDGPLFRVLLFPPHPWSSFVAYESAEEGCADYVQFLSCNDRYKAAWHAACVGDPVAFSHALGAAHYYTADVDAYTHGLVSIFSHLLPICERIVSDQDHGVDESLRMQVQNLVASTLSSSDFFRTTETDLLENAA